MLHSRAGHDGVMATGFDTKMCPFCEAPVRPVEYVGHVDSCMRISVSDGTDHEMYPPLAEQLKPYDRKLPVAGSDPKQGPEPGSDGGGLFGRWRG